MERRCVSIRKKKAKTILWILTGGILFSGSALTTGAYLTRSTEKVQNMLAPGTVLAEVTEPEWGEKDGQAMLPGESRKKNPMVRNVGTLDAWMFLEVEIPVKMVSLVDSATRKKQPEGEQELFLFTVNEKWKLIEKNRIGDAMHYVYGYEQLLAPMEQTPALFETITMVPYLEGSLDDSEIQQIPVTVKAIQKNIAPEETNLEELYQIYAVQQEKEGSEQS